MVVVAAVHSWLGQGVVEIAAGRLEHSVAVVAAVGLVA